MVDKDFFFRFILNYDCNILCLSVILIFIDIIKMFIIYLRGFLKIDYFIIINVKYFLFSWKY